MRRLITSLALAALLLASATPSTNAYVKADWYYFGGSLDGGLAVCGDRNTPMFNARARILDTLNLWNQGSSIFFYNLPNGVACGEGVHANVQFHKQYYGVPGCDLLDSFAYTADPGGGGTSTIHIYVNGDCIDAAEFYFADLPVDNNDLRDGISILAHEVGHALGLCHSNVLSPEEENICGGGVGPNGMADVMDAGGPNNNSCNNFQGKRLTRISLDDLNGLNSKYPSRAKLGPWPNGSAVCVD